MKCPLCGLEFQQEEGTAACANCPLSKGCNMVRCPNCDYEIPLETGLVKALKSLRKGHGHERKT
jgi:rubredoxin